MKPWRCVLVIPFVIRSMWYNTCSKTPVTLFNIPVLLRVYGSTCTCYSLNISISLKQPLKNIKPWRCVFLTPSVLKSMLYNPSSKTPVTLCVIPVYVCMLSSFAFDWHLRRGDIHYALQSCIMLKWNTALSMLSIFSKGRKISIRLINQTCHLTELCEFAFVLCSKPLKMI